MVSGDAPWEAHQSPLMDAYYYDFSPTGDPGVDWVLHAVAVAGKGAHSTDRWTDDDRSVRRYLESHGLRGTTFEQGIQFAAQDAANHRASADPEAAASGSDAARALKTGESAMRELRILVTGSRTLTDANLVARVLERAADGAGSVTLVHGGARGADALAERYGRARGWSIERHNADWERFGKAAGMIRNSEMVRRGADVCVAFPVGESRGTRHAMRLAGRAGIPVVNATDVDDARDAAAQP